MSNKPMPMPEMDEETREAFAKMGFSMEELTKDVDALNEHSDKRRSRKVCICGHTHTKHKRNSLGDLRCRPNARYCHCDAFRGVIETSNLRVFMRFSRGNDTLHALSQGIHALMQEGGSFKWIEGACICQKCGATDEIIPVVITTDGLAAIPDKDKITGLMDILLCRDCNVKLQKTGTITW